MKRSVCSLALLFMFLFTFAQDVEITFRPAAESDVIDSIRATNQRTNQSILVSGNGPFVLKNITTGSNDIKNRVNKGLVYPNPALEVSNLYFRLSDKQEVGIKVYTLAGVLLHHTNRILEQGVYNFQISFPSAGVYFASLLMDGSIETFRIISIGGKTQNSSLLLQEGAGIVLPEDIGLKRAVTDNAIMDYHDGDVILYSVYSEERITVIADVPTETREIVIEFVECKDPDNRNYKVVNIGEQWWMAENLAYLPAVSGSSQGSGTTPHYYIYGYQGTDVAVAKQHVNYITYGVRYNWPAAMAGAASSSANPSGVQGICPEGWHLPSESEWTQLENYLIANGFNYDGTTTGNKIAKSLASTTHWKTNSYSGAVGNNLSMNNKSGFSALPGGGLMLHSAAIEGLGYDCGWWTSEEYNGILAWHFDLQFWNSELKRFYDGKGLQFSVRCVKDSETGSSSTGN